MRVITLMPMLTECPHCNSIWTMEEIDWQECDACGYPQNDATDDHEDFVDED